MIQIMEEENKRNIFLIRIKIIVRIILIIIHVYVYNLEPIVKYSFFR